MIDVVAHFTMKLCTKLHHLFVCKHELAWILRRDPLAVASMHADSNQKHYTLGCIHCRRGVRHANYMDHTYPTRDDIHERKDLASFTWVEP